MKPLTMKELGGLTQKQIKEYVRLQKPGAKAPKKWKDKTSALKWAEETLAGKAPKVAKTAKVTKKAPGKTLKMGSGIERRQAMVLLLKKEPCTSDELVKKFKVKYKGVLDDVHAIRHGRGKTDYLKKDERLVGVKSGYCKIFFICNKKDENKRTEKILKSLEAA